MDTGGIGGSGRHGEEPLGDVVKEAREGAGGG